MISLAHLEHSRCRIACWSGKQLHGSWPQLQSNSISVDVQWRASTKHVSLDEMSLGHGLPSYTESNQVGTVLSLHI
jgi:hypothetical protein